MNYINIQLDEKITIIKDGKEVSIQLCDIKLSQDRVKLGFIANQDIKILREELLTKNQ